MRADYLDLTVPKTAIKTTIYEHPQFATFINRMNAHFAAWREHTATTLKGLAVGFHPKEMITDLSEGLLAHYTGQPLIDKYDIYQHLMRYWAETMQDDVYMLVVDGWSDIQPLREIIEDKDSKSKEKPDLVINKKKYKADLIPPELIIARYFAVEQQAIEDLEADAEAIAQQMQELDEEHGGEVGALYDAKNDKGNLTKGGVKALLKEIQDDPDEIDAQKILQQYLNLMDDEKAIKDQIKQAREALDEQVFAKYSTLSDADVKTLVVDDKWLKTLSTNVDDELDRVSQTLSGRIKQLAERYATPLPDLTERAHILGESVNDHLRRMGFLWQ